MTPIYPVATWFLAACAPTVCPPSDNLTVTNAQYVAYVSSASPSLADPLFDPDAFPDAYHLDCRGLPAGEGLPNPIDVCDDWPEWPPPLESWPTQDGYYVVHEGLAACDARAALTELGTFELSFSHVLHGGAVAQFALSVVPDFAPDTGDGDWITAWSRELASLADPAGAPGAFDHLAPYADGGELFFLDAGAFQFDPRNPSRALPMPSEWYAGSATAVFVAEELRQRPTYYADPTAYADGAFADSGDLYYCDLDAGSDPAASSCMEDLAETLETTASATADTLDGLFRRWPEAAPFFAFAPIPHLNDWRTPDGLAEGLDAWGQLAYSYVVFGEGSDLSSGSAAGAFTVVYEAEPGPTRVFLRGEFETVP